MLMKKTVSRARHHQSAATVCNSSDVEMHRAVKYMRARARAIERTARGMVFTRIFLRAAHDR